MKRLLSLLLALPLAAAAQAPGDSGAVAADYNAFGFRLLQEMSRAKAAPNIFVSPPSLAFALCMVQNGAAGPTLEEMQTTLGVANLPLPELNRRNKELLAALQGADPKVTLEIANAIWCDQKAVLKQPFIDVNKNAFDAQMASADFQNPATVRAINQWCADKTHGKIPEIVEPPLDAELRIILLDAIYFKGDWAAPFDKNQTRDKPFTLADGSPITVPLMAKSGKMSYSDTPGFQAVQLPYGNGRFRMWIFLPKIALADFIAQLDPVKWAAPSNWNGFQWRKGSLELPRFKLQNEYSLNDALKALGIRQAFSAGADLSGISPEPLNISWVKQKTYVDVNEQGTEAAAVTAVGVNAMAMPIEEPPPFRMIVDKPFFVAIQEQQTGLFLFLGAINDPR